MMRLLRLLALPAAILLALGSFATSLILAQSKPESVARPFCKALPGYRFEFPRDHFSHPCFRTEWWYFTGNVATAEGRRFGFQLTFFREGVDNSFPNPSHWRVDDLYLAHFAISDLTNQRFFHAQKISRAGIGLAGIDAAQGRIWNGTWSAEVSRDTWKLTAAEGGNRIELELKSRKAPVIQGKNGISQKAAGEGNASHYYSLTRLETTGRMHLDGTSYSVSGWSWMDHEFSTSQLQLEQVGWEWVSVQMEGGIELMLFQLRRKDGAKDFHSAGSFVDPVGRVVQLSAEDFEMLPLAEWSSPHSGARYPIRWRVQVPRLGLDIEIFASMPDQELDARETAGLFYWEGSIQARGERNRRPVEGRGYLEMTGYAGPLPSGLY